jgi:hypothetical protein
LSDAVDQLEKKLLERVGPANLIPWTECVGKIVKVTDDSITLQASRNISIMITPDQLKKWKKLFRKGEHVGILALDYGSIRVRRLPIAGSIFDSIGS